MPAKPRLQNTLSHFLDREPGEVLEGARLLPLVLIQPNPQQARQVFDEAKLTELATSIADHGVIEPIVVRPDGDQYQIVAGERRFRAAGMAGLAEIPAIIREDLQDTQAALLTALENLQREDLDIEDEGRMYETLLAQGVAASERELARQLGVDRSRINRARRLAVVPALCQQLRSGAITLRQAVAALNDEGVAHGEPGELAEREDLDAEGMAHGEPQDAGVLAHGEPRGSQQGVAHGEPHSPVVWRPLYQWAARMERWVPTVTRQGVRKLPPMRRQELRQQIDTLRGQLAQLDELLGEE